MRRALSVLLTAAVCAGAAAVVEALGDAGGGAGASIGAEAIAVVAGASCADGASPFFPFIDSATASASMLPMIANAIATKSGDRPGFFAGIVSGKACVDTIPGACTIGARDEIGFGICGIGGATDTGMRPDEIGPDAGGASMPIGSAMTAGGGSGESSASVPTSMLGATSTCDPPCGADGASSGSIPNDGFVTEIGVRSSALSSSSSNAGRSWGGTAGVGGSRWGGGSGGGRDEIFDMDALSGCGIGRVCDEAPSSRSISS